MKSLLKSRFLLKNASYSLSANFATELRGVLAWEFALESGASKTINLSYELQWPEGHELRVQP